MIPEIYMFIICGVWIYMVFLLNRLTRLFISKYPDIAKEQIPHLLERYRQQHPEHVLFFLRPSKRVYFQNDPKLLKLRKQLIVAVWLSALGPLLILLSIFIYMILFSQ
jgi:hypothetical protein